MEFVYKLTHTYNPEPRFTYVRSNLPSQNFEKLVAFIEFKSADIDECYGVDQEEVAEVLSKLYGATMLDDDGECPDAVEIDQYINWERYCGIAEEIEKIEEFQREELNSMLECYSKRHRGADAE